MKSFDVLKNTLTTCLCLLSFALSTSLSAQDSDYISPKLSFGVPDLQGIWNYATRTSLERPSQHEALEIDEATMLETLEPTSQILDDYQNFGTNRRNDAANVGGYDPEYFSIGDAMAKIDGMYRTSIIVDPADGQIPWREQGRSIRRQQGSSVFGFPESLGRSDGPEGRPLSDRCLKAFSSSTPFLSSVYNNNMQIIQSPDHVVLVVEMVHDARIVRIDQDHRDLPFHKWSGEMPMHPSQGLYEYSCHEGNHALPGILAGARRLEHEERNK